MTAPDAWRNPHKARRCRPRPLTDAPPVIPDSKVGQLDTLLHDSGILPLIDQELQGRPGPDGLPVRTVLVGLLLALHYGHGANLADAYRILADHLRPTARSWLGVPDLTGADAHARLAFSRRVYRAFDRLTTALDPRRGERRRRLPAAEAAVIAASWEDDDPEHVRRRALLQEISDRLVLVTVQLAYRHGLFTGWPGDIGADTTPIPSWHHPPSRRRELASVDLTAGWHYCGGAEEGIFGHSATLLVAASRSHPDGARRAGERVSRHPQLALGLVLDTPGKRVGPNAVHTLTRLAAHGLGLPAGLLAADRAYTDQLPAHFAVPARRLGYQLVLDYKQEHRGLQGSTASGALLVDGSLACPAMPDALVHATTNLDDKAVREAGDDEPLTQLLAARTPFFLKRKQNPDPHGTIRLQCPAAGPSPSVSCARFHQVHQIAATRPVTVDLTNPRATTAHTAAKPTVPIPTAERLRPPAPEQLPKICQRPTVTVHPGSLGKIDKFRQDRHYLQPSWQDAYRPARANIEGLNGRAKSHGVNIADPARRLAHGRVAQTVLLALMIFTTNLGILHSWTQTSPPTADEFAEENIGGDEQQPPISSASGIPPPAGTRTTATT
ncbi:hypothetical protein F7R91_12145 [Streptomyces luteolifulvus]|uniref:Uncharacterized protein n=1 Tax=Streptomyces luteolifulvus TaxID=2615112 RepID=A0A6H9V1R1_9ACTN|nr:hypothetical protein [Streptomyces luteolifulvus]KAB1147088.1 hypothetical protein F7R91_12145 [Streptomyces luteolifulvus]